MTPTDTGSAASPAQVALARRLAALAAALGVVWLGACGGGIMDLPKARVRLESEP